MLMIAALASLAGCRNNESPEQDAGGKGMTAQGVGGTGVGARSTAGQGDVMTGSSTQRAGTGFGGAVSAPGPGQSGSLLQDGRASARSRDQNVCSAWLAEGDSSPPAR